MDILTFVIITLYNGREFLLLARKMLEKPPGHTRPPREVKWYIRIFIPICAVWPAQFLFTPRKLVDSRRLKVKKKQRRDDLKYVNTIPPIRYYRHRWSEHRFQTKLRRRQNLPSECRQSVPFP